MHHPKPGELDRITPLLDDLRALEGLTERNPAVFYHRSKAFLHFHIDVDDVYADVRLTGPGFDRMRVTTKTEQRRLLTLVKQTLASRG